MPALIVMIGTSNAYIYFPWDYSISILKLLCHMGISCDLGTGKKRISQAIFWKPGRIWRAGDLEFTLHSFPSGFIFLWPCQTTNHPQTLRKLQSLQVHSWNLELLFKVVENCDNRALNINTYRPFWLCNPME